MSDYERGIRDAFSFMKSHSIRHELGAQDTKKIVPFDTARLTADMRADWDLLETTAVSELQQKDVAA